MKGNETMNTLFDINLTFTDYLIILLMVICIATDIKSRRIYNYVLIPFLLAGLAAGFHAGGWQGLMDDIQGFLVGLVLLLIPFARGGVGGGDVKLLAVIGGIKGPAFVIGTFLYGAMAGGILALALLVRHRRLAATPSGGLASASGFLIRYGIVLPVAGRPVKEAKPLHLPYSLAIGAGVAASYYIWMQNLAG